MRDCPTCGLQTPEGNFCVRCGAPLEGGLEHSRQRHEFAAAPGERRYAPWLISTLFPQLPRHSERHFRIALALGATLVAVLGALRLFPVALIAAAALMPLLTILYFYDVDIYEENPIWASAWTLIWGVATGVAVGLLAKAVAPSGTALIDRGSSGHVITGGIVVPAVGVVAMLVGPMVLLRFRRFNEALDGAAFGAATAATFSAAQAVVVGVEILGAGVRPQGAAAPWVARLLSIAVATPVLTMCGVGAASAAIWLRYRAPVKDRGALGIFGVPAVAVSVAAVLVIAGAVGETFMAAGVWLAWLVLLCLLGLMLLRRALHVGLLEEAAEREIGPEIECANCHARSAQHSFCQSCGIALKALPKPRPGAVGEAASAGAIDGRLTGRGHRRLTGHLAAYTAVMAAVVGLAFLIAALAAPPPPKPACKLRIRCGAPPILPQVVFAFPGYTAWQSSGLGYSLRYKSSDWQVSSQDANDVALQAADGFSLLIVNAVPTSNASPLVLGRRKVATLKDQLLGLVRDTDTRDQILGTAVGLRPGPGGVFRATISSPQGPQTPAAIAVMASGDGRVSIVVTVITPGDNPQHQLAVYERADDIINSVQWAG
jgi:hypothetical protein